MPRTHHGHLRPVYSSIYTRFTSCTLAVTMVEVYVLFKLIEFSLECNLLHEVLLAVEAVCYDAAVAQTEVGRRCRADVGDRCLASLKHGHLNGILHVAVVATVDEECHYLDVVAVLHVRRNVEHGVVIVDSSAVHVVHGDTVLDAVAMSNSMSSSVVIFFIL